MDRMPRNYLERYGVEYLKPGEGMVTANRRVIWAILSTNAARTWACRTRTRVGADVLRAGHGYPSGAGRIACSLTNTPASRPGNELVGRKPTRLRGRCLLSNQVVKAFRKMEELGVREPVMRTASIRGSSDYGPHTISTCINLPRGLSPAGPADDIHGLANYLYDGVVWKLFARTNLLRRHR